MQKKLIALAIAGLSTAAFADTANVTLYGVMDATLDSVSATGATTGIVNATTLAAVQGTNLDGRQRTTFNSSYVGFKGVEAIGNGLAVAFQIETGIGESPTGSVGSSTTGNTSSSNTWANRDTYVGLAGGFGTVAFGNLTGPTRALGAAMDVNSGATGIGANTALLAKFGGGSGAGLFDQRIANAIAYISPAMSGATVVIGYLPNENRGNDTTPQHSQLNTSGWTAGVTYANGPIFVGAAYTTLKDGNADGTASALTYGNNTVAVYGAVQGVSPAISAIGIQDASDTRLGAKYDFGMGTVGLLWDSVKATTATALSLGDAKQTVYYIPVTFNLGSGKLIAQYGAASKLKIAGSDVTNTDATHMVVGYEYNLSKRTTVKAVYSSISNKDFASYDFLYGVSAQNTTAYGAGVNAGADPTGFSVGVRHSF